MSQTICQFRVNTRLHRPFSNFSILAPYSFRQDIWSSQTIMWLKKCANFLLEPVLSGASAEKSRTEPYMGKADILRTTLYLVRSSRKYVSRIIVGNLDFGYKKIIQYFTEFLEICVFLKKVRLWCMKNASPLENWTIAHKFRFQVSYIHEKYGVEQKPKTTWNSNLSVQLNYTYTIILRG